MTSFLLCYPDVPRQALVVTPSAAFAEDHPVESTFYGERHAYGQLAANATSFSVTYDLGTGNSRTVDHLILGGAQVLRNQGVTQVTLQGSGDGSTWVNQLGTAAGFQTRTFDGPDGHDVIFTPTYNDQYAATLAAYRYWKLTIASPGAQTFPVSKIYFGSALDLAAEPDWSEPEISTERDADTWQFPRGHVVMSRAYGAKYRFTVQWDGVTDAAAQAFSEKLLANPVRDHLFAYTGLHLDPLFDNKLVHCRVLDGETSLTKSNQRPDWWDLSILLEEL